MRRVHSTGVAIVSCGFKFLSQAVLFYDVCPKVEVKVNAFCHALSRKS